MTADGQTTESVPHAHAVEVLWNQGSRSERWALAMEMGDTSRPLSMDEAVSLLEEMVEDGHGRDAVRLVGVVVVPYPPDQTDPKEVGRG